MAWSLHVLTCVCADSKCQSQLHDWEGEGCCQLSATSCLSAYLPARHSKTRGSAVIGYMLQYIDTDSPLASQLSRYPASLLVPSLVRQFRRQPVSSAASLLAPSLQYTVYTLYIYIYTVYIQYIYSIYSIYIGYRALKCHALSATLSVHIPFFCHALPPHIVFLTLKKNSREK